MESTRSRELRHYLPCELLQLTQENVQVGGCRFDDNAIDTSRTVLLDSPENCVGVALKGGLGVAISNEVSDTRPHPHGHLEFRFPSECVDCRYGCTHLLRRSPQAVPAIPQRRCALQRGRTVTTNKDGDAIGRSGREHHVGVVDVLTVEPGVSDSNSSRIAEMYSSARRPRCTKSARR